MADALVNQHNASGKISDNPKVHSNDLTSGAMMANGRFMITKSIGKGSFGEIFQGLDTQTNKEIAIKMVSLTTAFFCSLRV